MQNQIWLHAFSLSESNFDSINGFSSQELSGLRIEVIVGRVQICTLGRSFTTDPAFVSQLERSVHPVRPVVERSSCSVRPNHQVSVRPNLPLNVRSFAAFVRQLERSVHPVRPVVERSSCSVRPNHQVVLGALDPFGTVGDGFKAV
ncbi:hypothetical protein LR48_Vigan442s008400 [Vigna angularis]|uniref:Uncharacterized protein n=1 Tax=Phaseolus angularis TaxID=3914 RepID=A0A0L9TAR3_PHAAN|nr:hypothetical protein LR48_Vigan442s008400 [Vigna angularis]